MNLYLISQTSNNDYDTYDSAVVCAESEDAARTMHPSGDDSAWERHRGVSWATWCQDPKDVSVRRIGRPAAGVKRGVVLASFNAG